MKIKNGTIWKDTQGNILHAHGGWILLHEGVYYWYGENRLDNLYVSCYSSTDLVNWTFRNHVLTTESPTASYRVRTDVSLRNANGGKVNLERPKVAYHPEARYCQELCANTTASLMKLVRRRPNRPWACSAWLPVSGPPVVRQGWRSHLRSP